MSEWFCCCETQFGRKDGGDDKKDEMKDDRTMKGISWISVVSCVEHDHVKARLF